MRKTTLFIAMSLDGLIADEHGGVDWLHGHGDEPDAFDPYPEFIEHIDTVLMGWNTYHQVTTELSPTEWPYENLRTYVFTHRAIPQKAGITFTDENPSELVRHLKSEPGGGIWICGGESIVSQLMQDDLIDCFHVSVIPMLLGNGIRLFGNAFKQMRLRLTGTISYDGIVDLIYERQRQPRGDDLHE